MHAPGTEPEPGSGGGDGVPPAAAPHRVGVPVNLHRWDQITFLHWRFDPAVVRRVVPAELSVLTYDGAAWVGVTPFRIRVRIPWLPALPFASGFPEINLRTYVAGADGRQGLWFVRMEVPRLWFVLALRAFGLPYFWPRMAVERRAQLVAYASQPRAPGTRGARSRVVVRPGDPIQPVGGGPRDRFLTARWGAYHRVGPRLLYTPVEHPPWPLHDAAVELCDVAPLFRAAGLPPPRERPLAHFSPGVAVRVGPPRLVHG